MKTNDPFVEAEPMYTVPTTSTPAYANRHPIARAFDYFASAVTRWAGSPLAFGLAVVSVIAWLVSGPVFHFSENWQLVINTGTTIVTFLMVFLIQQSANKDSVAVHLKLNELLASHRSANNQLIGIEDASEDELRKLAAAYLKLAADEESARRHLSDDFGAAADIARRLAETRARSVNERSS
ncbi:low affinity iron permease family protein [Caballeronia sp. LZ003]|uniref:low affinity iron permease family protein n=1 Tax=unclassified Caballeronia TaxID=2646786 RepID=UPI003857E0B8